MSKHLALLCLGALCLSAVTLVAAEIASNEFLKKQIIVSELFWRPGQPELQSVHYNVGINYNIEANLDSYKNEDHVKEFLEIYKKGTLPRGKIFSVFYPTILDEAVALFRILHESKDFDTFHKTAAWARIFMNEGQFIYSFSIAVLRHPETQHIRIPAFHEIYPHLYFDNDIIRKAYDAKTNIDPKNVSALESPIIIFANYSEVYSGEDNRLQYFTDNVEINDLMYHTHIALPFWMSSKEYKLTPLGRGRVFLLLHILEKGRYYLERLSHDSGEVEDFDWNYPIPDGYQPNLNYHNGFAVAHRHPWAEIPRYNYKHLRTIRDLEFHLSTVVNSGYVLYPNGSLVSILTSDGTEILGNLIEGNADSVNFHLYGKYERTAKSLLGFSPEPLDKHDVYPSILEYYGVNWRDPIYWSLNERLVDFYERYQSKMPKYTYQELAFDGVEIKSVSIDRITTFMEEKDYLITNVVKAYGPDDRTVIKVRKLRLNHKPYTFVITVNSDEEAKATIRIFIGPPQNHKAIDDTVDYKHFWPIDVMSVDLKPGTNVFERNNTQNVISVPDEQDGYEFYKKILRAYKGEETYDIPRGLYGYPENLVIPMGTREGSPYQFFFHIAPYKGEEFYHCKHPVLAERDFFHVPSMFPMDRPVFSNFTKLPNVLFKEVGIYHVEQSEINEIV